jgi:tetratricopeptide (TPR) repeat protein
MQLPPDSSTTNMSQENWGICQAAAMPTSEKLAIEYCEHGRNLLEAREYTQAKSNYQVAIECDPKSSIAYSGLARTNYHLHDYAAALVAINIAIQYDDTRTDFYHQRALISKCLNDYHQVLADCKIILARSPRHQAARGLQSIALVKTKNYQVAILDFDRHIEVYPQDPYGHCYRGICYDRLNRPDLALADFNRAIALKPDEPVFHHARGRTYQHLGNDPAALADYALAIQSKPLQASVYDDRAELYHRRGDLDKALADCTQAIVLNPKLIAAYLRRGSIYAGLGNLTSTLADYNRILTIDPHHVKTYIQRSWVYFRQGEYILANNDCEAVKSVEEVSFWASYLIGAINAQFGYREQAIVNLTRAIYLEPDNISARYYRGINYYELGQIDLATVDFTHARSMQAHATEPSIVGLVAPLENRDETGLYAEGLALYYTGQLESARTLLSLAAASANKFNNLNFSAQISTFIDRNLLK